VTAPLPQSAQGPCTFGIERLNEEGFIDGQNATSRSRPEIGLKLIFHENGGLEVCNDDIRFKLQRAPFLARAAGDDRHPIKVIAKTGEVFGPFGNHAFWSDDHCEIRLVARDQ